MKIHGFCLCIIVLCIIVYFLHCVFCIIGTEGEATYMWWDQNGTSCKELQAVARMVLAQLASASICERINSEFGLVKDRRRSKLSHVRANKLVALFHNLRLMKRVKTEESCLRLR